MTTFLIIIASIVFTGAAAYLIVNYIPKKSHWMVSTALLIMAAFLAFKIYAEILKPINFNKEKKVRYAKVIKNLKLLRDAQVAHKKVTGKYNSNGEHLIQFIDTAQYALTQTRNVPKTIRLGGGITKEIEERVVDTIGYEDVRASFIGRDYQNMLQIPGTDEQFKIDIGEVEKIAGLRAAVFEIKVDKGLILEDMDINLVKQEKEAIGGEEVRGEYLRVGSLSEVSEDGNWPPFYDKGDKKNNES